MNCFNRLPLQTGNKLIIKAFYEKDRQEYWEIWVASYPYMDTTTFKPFNQFFRESLEDRMPKKLKSTKQMLQEAEAIQTKIQNGYFKEVKM